MCTWLKYFVWLLLVFFFSWLVTFDWLSLVENCPKSCKAPVKCCFVLSVASTYISIKYLFYSETLIDYTHLMYSVATIIASLSETGSCLNLAVITVTNIRTLILVTDHSTLVVHRKLMFFIIIRLLMHHLWVKFLKEVIPVWSFALQRLEPALWTDTDWYRPKMIESSAFTLSVPTVCLGLPSNISLFGAKKKHFAQELMLRLDVQRFSWAPSPFFLNSWAFWDG